jgi:phage baseplate assembly protein W
MAQQYVGITLPIRRGNTGMFEQSTTTYTQIRSNFKNLILTTKGERIMQPDFGTDLKSILFNQLDAETTANIRSTIVDAVERWMPFLELQNVTVKAAEDNNPNGVQVNVSYRFRNNPNVTDAITVVV